MNLQSRLTAFETNADFPGLTEQYTLEIEPSLAKSIQIWTPNRTMFSPERRIRPISAISQRRAPLRERCRPGGFGVPMLGAGAGAWEAGEVGLQVGEGSAELSEAAAVEEDWE